VIEKGSGEMPDEGLVLKWRIDTEKNGIKTLSIVAYERDNEVGVYQHDDGYTKSDEYTASFETVEEAEAELERIVKEVAEHRVKALAHRHESEGWVKITP